ncbi:Protein of unknown function [Gryllus bimaculatus]|nr:Protein of unknown function [Gryllus bimaculatus]
MPPRPTITNASAPSASRNPTCLTSRPAPSPLHRRGARSGRIVAGSGVLGRETPCRRSWHILTMLHTESGKDENRKELNTLKRAKPLNNEGIDKCHVRRSPVSLACLAVAATCEPGRHSPLSRDRKTPPREKLAALICAAGSLRGRITSAATPPLRPAPRPAPPRSAPPHALRQPPSLPFVAARPGNCVCHIFGALAQAWALALAGAGGGEQQGWGLGQSARRQLRHHAMATPPPDTPDATTHCFIVFKEMKLMAHKENMKENEQIVI